MGSVNETLVENLIKIYPNSELVLLVTTNNTVLSRITLEESQMEQVFRLYVREDFNKISEDYWNVADLPMDSVESIHTYMSHDMAEASKLFNSKVLQWRIRDVVPYDYRERPPDGVETGSDQIQTKPELTDEIFLIATMSDGFVLPIMFACLIKDGNNDLTLTGLYDHLIKHLVEEYRIHEHASGINIFRFSVNYGQHYGPHSARVKARELAENPPIHLNKYLVKELASVRRPLLNTLKEAFKHGT